MIAPPAVPYDVEAPALIRPVREPDSHLYSISYSYLMWYSISTKVYSSALNTPSLHANNGFNYLILYVIPILVHVQSVTQK